MRNASVNSAVISRERPSLARSNVCTATPHPSRKVTASSFADGASARGVLAKLRLMRARSDPIEDCTAIEIIEARRDVSCVQFDAAQIDRGRLDGAVAEQDLQDFERVDIRLDCGLRLETHQHGRGKCVPKAMQRAIEPCGSEGCRKRSRESRASYADAMAIKEQVYWWPILW